MTIAGSDSGGGAGIQADLKAFAAAGCHGTSAIVALTAQNTTGVTAVHEVPPDFVRAQLEAVFEDIGVDAAKTGMLFSAALIETVADFLAGHPVPARGRPGDGGELRRAACCRRTRSRRWSSGSSRWRRWSPRTCPRPRRWRARDAPGELAERLHERGAPAVIVTGGHSEEPVDHLFDGERHVEIPVERHAVAATHGAGCTHSATLAGAPRPGTDPG